MVLVDSSVWIGFFGGHEPDAARVKNLLAVVNRVVICGVVIQEVVQGIRSERRRDHVAGRLSLLPFVEAGREEHLEAAELYAGLRKRGITVPPADALIAALSIRNRHDLLTRDRHFDAIAEQTRLRLV